MEPDHLKPNAAVPAEESRAEESRAEESRAEESRAEESRAEESRAEESRAEESRAEESRAEESREEGMAWRRQRVAVEPDVLVGVPKKCPRCGSTDVKFRYFNNKKLDQPRYQCLSCHDFYTHGGKILPTQAVSPSARGSAVDGMSRGTERKRKAKEPPQYANMAKPCRRCGSENTAFKYLNNGQVNQPRYKCLNCKELFQFKRSWPSSPKDVQIAAAAAVDPDTSVSPPVLGLITQRPSSPKGVQIAAAAAADPDTSVSPPVLRLETQRLSIPKDVQIAADPMSTPVLTWVPIWTQRPSPRWLGMQVYPPLGPHFTTAHSPVAPRVGPSRGPAHFSVSPSVRPSRGPVQSGVAPRVGSGCGPVHFGGTSRVGAARLRTVAGKAVAENAAAD